MVFVQRLEPRLSGKCGRRGGEGGGERRGEGTQHGLHELVREAGTGVQFASWKDVSTSDCLVHQIANLEKRVQLCQTYGRM